MQRLILDCWSKVMFRIARGEQLGTDRERVSARRRADSRIVEAVMVEG